LDNWRAISSKWSQLLLVALGFLVSYNLIQRKYFHISFLLMLACSFTVLLSDASRAAVLPLGVVLIYSLVYKRYFWSVLLFILILPILGFAETARGYFAFGNRTFDDIITILYSLKIFDFGYLTAYSFIHMMVVQEASNVYFSYSDLFYSIIPIPSNFHFLDFNLEDWRLDKFRPMSGVSQILFLGPVPFMALYLLFGLFLTRISDKERNATNVLSAIFLVLSILIAHQYLLRGAMWFFYLHLAFSLFRAPNSKTLRAGMPR
jgi:hypothetical protein